MKLRSLALVAALTMTGLAWAQTPPSSSAAPAAPPADKASSSGKIDHACQKEIRDLCGRAHGQEMQDCVKSGLDMNKFSDSCKAEIKAHGSKSSSAAKPST
jgi:hypothetical protein